MGWDSSLAALTPCECINGGVPIVSPGNVRTRDWENPALSLSLSRSHSLSFKNLKGPHKNVNVSADKCPARTDGRFSNSLFIVGHHPVSPPPGHTDGTVHQPGTAICPCMLHHICSPDLCSSLSERSQYPLAECLVAIIDNLSPSQEALNVLGNSQGPPRGR